MGGADDFHGMLVAADVLHRHGEEEQEQERGAFQVADDAEGTDRSRLGTHDEIMTPYGRGGASNVRVPVTAISPVAGAPECLSLTFWSSKV